MRQIKTLHVGPYETNCYLIGNPETEQLIIIDPGAEPDTIREEIRGMNMLPVAIFLTHGHFDHIGAVRELQSVFDIPVIAGQGGESFLKDYSKIAPKGAEEYFPESLMHFSVNRYVEDEELVEYAGFPITCLATPWHTEDGVCYFFPTEAVLFSGDTLFMESVGRTDLPTGDMKTLVESIRKQLYRLPNETLVFPGHGPATNIEYEKRYNMYTWEKGQTKETVAESLAAARAGKRGLFKRKKNENPEVKD